MRISDWSSDVCSSDLPKEWTDGGRLKGLTVYIADDQEEARQLVGEVLSEQGCEVQLFASGLSLLSALRERAPDQWPNALICDISLGEPDRSDERRVWKECVRQCRSGG